MELIEAEYPRPGHVLLHLSDPHLVGGPDTLYGAVDSEARLKQSAKKSSPQGSGPRPSFSQETSRTKASWKPTNVSAT